MKNIYLLITMIGAAILGFATVGSIIYIIYLWGGQNIDLPVALWEGAKIWMMTSGLGITLFVLGMFGMD